MEFIIFWDDAGKSHISCKFSGPVFWSVFKISSLIFFSLVDQFFNSIKFGQMQFILYNFSYTFSDSNLRSLECCVEWWGSTRSFSVNEMFSIAKNGLSQSLLGTSRSTIAWKSKKSANTGPRATTWPSSRKKRNWRSRHFGASKVPSRNLWLGNIR